MKVILILQETPLDFVGDKQWVVYANQVPIDTHIPPICDPGTFLKCNISLKKRFTETFLCGLSM